MMETDDILVKFSKWDRKKLLNLWQRDVSDY